MKRLWLALASILMATILFAPIAAFAQDADVKGTDGDPVYAGLTSLTIIESFSKEQQTNIDLGVKGASQGDILVYTGSLTDENGKKSGMSSGFCITTDSKTALAECVWTYHLADGTITVSGTEPDLGANVEIQMPVVGGTGAYAGARGIIHEQHNEDQTVFTATVEIATASLLTSTEPMTETESMTSTEGMTGTEGMTKTEAMTGTEGMTQTEAMTETEGTTGTESMTQTEAMTKTAPSRADNPDAYWNSIAHWTDIAKADQAAWNVLGWNETNWENTDPSTIPATDTTTWAELTSDEQTAATTLGYDEASWTTVLPRMPKGDVEKFWNSIATWDDLRYSEKRLWGILGWNAKNWTANPQPEGKLWAKLTAEQRAAAEQLGYDQKTWDAVAP